MTSHASESAPTVAVEVKDPVGSTWLKEVTPDTLGGLVKGPHPEVPPAPRDNFIRGRRRIPPTAGHALEKLGHAIEYVTDEYIHEGCEGGFSGSRMSAIQLLMSLNRAVYYECPIIPNLSERIRGLMHRAVAR